jgi:hypothetical protein
MCHGAQQHGPKWIIRDNTNWPCPAGTVEVAAAANKDRTSRTSANQGVYPVTAFSRRRRPPALFHSSFPRIAMIFPSGTSMLDASSAAANSDILFQYTQTLALASLAADYPREIPVQQV